MALKSWAEENKKRELNLWNGGTSFEDRIRKLQEDMSFLDVQLAKLGNDTQDAKELLRQHFQLSQDMTLFRLSFLAAIFLPLSFATSFFGMNINSATSEGPSGFSNYLTETIETVPTEMRNSTRALVSIIGTSGSLGYDWKTFGITAGCLLLTLPLTLLIGALLRMVVVSVAKSTRYWRLGVFVAALVFIFFSIGMPWIARGIPYWIVNGILILYSGWQTYRSWVERHRHHFWSAFSATLATAFIVDNVTAGFFYVGVPFMMAPWAFLALEFMYQRFANTWPERKSWLLRTDLSSDSSRPQ